MFSYGRLSKRSEIFRTFTGLEVSEFDSLHSKIESKYEEYERKRLSRPERKRKIGAGNQFKLSLRDRLLMLLVYYRTYVTSTLAGFLFNLDQSNVLKDIRMLEPLVKECIPIPKKVYEGAKRARTPEEVEKFARGASERGIKVIIAAAGMAAHLPGVIAAMTPLPVIGVPIKASLEGLDSIFSILQMPPGIPVATVGVNAAQNAGILAAQIIGTGDAEVMKEVIKYKEGLKKKIVEANEELKKIKYPYKTN